MELQLNDRTAHVAHGNRTIEAERDTVLFVHGAGQDHTIWLLPNRYFVRHGYNVVAVDLPGHGRSAGPPLATIEKMVDWIVALVDSLGLDRVAVVGHSMGSLVALDAAARHSDRVRSIALVGTAVPMPVSDALLDTSAADDHAALDMLNLWGHSSGAHIGRNPTPGMWMLGGGIRLLERAAPGVVHADLKACNDYQAGLERAATVACPALLILGQLDMMTPTRAARSLSDAIPNVETVLLPGAGHALLAERPDPVLDALIKIV